MQTNKYLYIISYFTLLICSIFVEKILFIINYVFFTRIKYEK